MLYDFREWQRSLLNPLASFNKIGEHVFSSPLSPFSYSPVAPHIAATHGLLHRLGKEYVKPEWHIATTTVDGKTVKVEPMVRLENPFCRLIYFKRSLPARRKADPKVLLVAPLSGHHATLLRDTVRSFLPSHEVYITDWLDARMVPEKLGEFSLNDYVNYIAQFLSELGPNLHVVAVCQPTVPVLAATALMASDNNPMLPRSLTLMGGPVDTRQGPTQVNQLATTKPYEWFEDNLIHRVPARYPGAGRKVYPGFLQHAGFVAMNADRHVESHYDYYLHLVQGAESDAQAHRRFYDEYNAVLDMPARFYLDTIQVVFQDQLLPKGEWSIDGRWVNPGDIRDLSLFTIEGELDDISGPGQTHAAHDLCHHLSPAQKQRYTAPGCGHYGIFSGRRWRSLIYPKIASFIAKVS